MRSCSDPKFGGPLYTGLKLDKNLNLVQERSPLLDVKAPTEGNDATAGGLAELDNYTTLGEVLKNRDFANLIRLADLLLGSDEAAAAELLSGVAGGAAQSATGESAVTGCGADD